MIAMEQIRELASRIVHEFSPERIVLFGSYAQGMATEESDVDLLIVTPTSLASPQRYAAVRRLAAEIPVSFDIIVKTPEEYERARKIVNNIVYYAEKYGTVLYERSAA